ncbi:exostosin-1-like [Watersipora subatra]|uniref:exostosin-1-like n=1 Tax=Watersipora subatra TaxID=2589382 RepID=UPI00355BF8EA
MRFHAKRPLTYTFLLCVTVVLLLSIQYSFGPITTTDDIVNSIAIRQQNKGDPPSSLLSSTSFLPSSAASYSVLEDVFPQFPILAANCRMDNCFDYSKCQQGFYVYVYPLVGARTPSESYLQIINVTKLSPFYTDDPEKACIYISSVDTLDRDNLSSDYVHNLQKELTSLSHWNNGRNHLIFNLYSGTWPDYSEQFGGDIGYAMLAKASVSTHRFRAGFDISLPLFHKTLPIRGGDESLLLNVNMPSNRKYLLSFKGKRYLTGIGSVSRNSLYHIHNGEDIVLLTTCRHGKDWERYADSRCEQDNSFYDRYEFLDLLANSTFCLVPRGRRLGSFRFLEVLQYGCIPVLLSDNWELPFSEVIDWRKAAVWGDESLLYQLPQSLRSMSYTRIASLQQQSQLLWTKYFSSLEKIVITTLQILKERVEKHNSLSLAAWNTHPGAYSLRPSYSKDLTLFPFFKTTNSPQMFTALLYVTQRSPSLRRFIENLASASYIHTIYIFVVNRSDLTGFVSAASRSIEKLPIRVRSISHMADSYALYEEFPTDAVMTINQRESLVTEEVDFVFSVWKEYPSRLVGHLARSFLWHSSVQKYRYTSKLSYQYSIVLMDTSVMHKYYLSELSVYMRTRLAGMDRCSDILLNFIISDAVGLPPVKVGQRLSFKSTPEQLAVHDSCMTLVYETFGYLPLKLSHIRLDPALFKDNVARVRKRYPLMEKLL